MNLFNSPQLLKARPNITTTILLQHRQPNDEWDDFLRSLLSFGEFYLHRRMVDVFLDLVRRGKIGLPHTATARHGDWWFFLHTAAKQRPDIASEAIGLWLEVLYQDWKVGSRETEFAHSLDHSGHGSHILDDAAKAPLTFATHILPVVVRIIDEVHCPSRSIWTEIALGDTEPTTATT